MKYLDLYLLLCFFLFLLVQLKKHVKNEDWLAYGARLALLQELQPKEKKAHNHLMTCILTAQLTEVTYYTVMGHFL